MSSQHIVRLLSWYPISLDIKASLFQDSAVSTFRHTVIQQIRLSPQRIRLKSLEGILYSLSALWVLIDLPSRLQTASQQPRLSSEEKASNSKERECCNIA